MKKDIDNGLDRWRLILGPSSDIKIDHNYSDIDDTLNFLYNREHNNNYVDDIENSYSDDFYTSSGYDDSILTIPTWIEKVKILFPKEAYEIMQRDALEKYHITELLEDEEIISNLEPNFELLKSILSFKDMMSDNVKRVAIGIVSKVVYELKKKLEINIQKSFSGAKLLNSNSKNKSLNNLDIKKTIKHNLKNYDFNNKKILIDKIYFNDRIKKYNKNHIIILIDQSASMTDSVIYSAIMASIFANLSFLSIKVVLFDINIVDISNYIDDTISMLMKVQLGGGTDITKALEYTKTIITEPQKSIVFLISDLEDTNKYLFKSAKDIIDSQSKLVVLPALDYKAKYFYNKEVASILKSLGARIEFLTPDNISDYIVDIIF